MTWAKKKMVSGMESRFLRQVAPIAQFAAQPSLRSMQEKETLWMASPFLAPYRWNGFLLLLLHGKNRRKTCHHPKFGQIWAAGPPYSLSWREVSESDRVPPDLDQRLVLASKPIAKR